MVRHKCKLSMLCQSNENIQSKYKKQLNDWCLIAEQDQTSIDLYREIVIGFDWFINRTKLNVNPTLIEHNRILNIINWTQANSIGIYRVSAVWLIFNLSIVRLISIFFYWFDNQTFQLRSPGTLTGLNWSIC